MLPILMAGIALAVDSSVVPFWHEYLLGGSSPKNLTGTFAKEFTNSPTTAKTTEFLRAELEKSLIAIPPTFIGGGSLAAVDIGARISSAITEIGTSGSANEMNFDIPKDIPGNLAGGIGADQTACKAGSQPSPFNDERSASGLAFITKMSSGDLQVEPIIKYVVKDTIDLCPGNCGTSAEQMATVIMSQFEATGISGDVPFTVEFPAPPTSFILPAPAKP
jgi:hypothetical protein